MSQRTGKKMRHGKNPNKISIHEFKKNYTEPSGYRKHRNKPVIVDGQKFDSISEYTRYNELLIRKKAGEIIDFEIQKKFEIIPKTETERATHYIADFFYFDKIIGKHIVEDRKSEETRKLSTYIIKRKLTKIRYPDYIFLES